MKFKEFVAWCNERTCDGCWGMVTAMTCIDIISSIRKVPFWKRKKIWAGIEPDVMEQIVNPINAKMAELQSNNR